MFNLKQEMEQLLKKHPDPRKGPSGVIEFEEKQRAIAGQSIFGIVADNKDPMCLGRVRVACDMIAPGVVTPWIPVISMYASKNSGWWLLPEIGVQVIVAFAGLGLHKPVVLGCVYDEKHRPPEHSTKRAADSKVIQTKNHRIEFIDEEGNESLIISTAKGQMRLVLRNGKGIEIVNELGDLTIKGRNILIRGKKGIHFKAKKSILRKSSGDIIYKAKRVKKKSGGEISFKAKNIYLNASRGITAEGRQMAAMGDKVAGFDVHNMIIPSGTGTSISPLPHPFLGKLVDNLSNNVKINRQNAATRGSIARHDSPVHNQLPGTISFQRPPRNEGRVTGATAKTVKINGKEAATVGSTVSTCNDIGKTDHSVVIAPGASIPMPMIINPVNMPEYHRERKKAQKQNPEFVDIHKKDICDEWERIEICALVKDIADGNAAAMRIWREGQDPLSHIPLEQKPCKIENGMVKADWVYSHPNDQELPAQNPKFFVTVHCAWCPPIRSGLFEVRLWRPEAAVIEREAVIYDEQGKETGSEPSDKVEYGKEAIIRVKTKEIEDGGLVNVTITDEITNRAKTYSVKIEGGEGYLRHKVKPSRRILAGLKEGDELRYKYTAQPAQRGKQKDGGSIKVVFTCFVKYFNLLDVNEFEDEFTLESTDGVYKQTCNALNENSTLVFTDVLPGKFYTLVFHNKKTGENYLRFSELPFSDLDFKE